MSQAVFECDGMQRVLQTGSHPHPLITSRSKVGKSLGSLEGIQISRSVVRRTSFMTSVIPSWLVSIGVPMRIRFRYLLYLFHS